MYRERRHIFLWIVVIFLFISTCELYERMKQVEVFVDTEQTEEIGGNLDETRR